MGESLPDESLEQIRQALFRGNKIEAIKLYRKFIPSELVEAKQAMDQLEAQLRAAEPEKFSAPAGKGCGAAACLVAGIVGVWLLAHA